MAGTLQRHGIMPHYEYPMQGAGWSDFTRWVRGAVRDTGKFIKNNHLVSTAAGFIPHPLGKAAAVGLRLGGLGRRRRRRKPQAGAGRRRPAAKKQGLSIIRA